MHHLAEEAENSVKVVLHFSKLTFSFLGVQLVAHYLVGHGKYIGCSGACEGTHTASPNGQILGSSG